MSKNLRKPFVAGNWKMNGNLALVAEFNQKLANVKADSEIVICAPSLLLHAFETHSFAIGAQNVSHLNNGAHTGELSVEMLKEAGCGYAIVGHSERREDQGESSELVALKAKQCVSSGVVPIICVGEPLEVREAGDVESFVGEQLDALVSAMSVDELSKTVIAYEPIWAIGTGRTATADDAQQVCASIRAAVMSSFGADAGASVRIQYGGSVKPGTTEELMAQPDIDGALVGGASLDPDDFAQIVKIAAG